MRITVDAAYGDQTRAYAEYRLFSTLKHFGDLVQHATVTLTPDGRGAVVCRVVIEMANNRRTEAAAGGRHPYGAIDRVAQKLESSMQELPFEGHSPVNEINTELAPD